MCAGWTRCRVEEEVSREGDGGKQGTGGGGKEAAASVERRQQPRRRAKGVLSPAQAAGVFSPARAAARRSWTAEVQPRELKLSPTHCGLLGTPVCSGSVHRGGSAPEDAWPPGARRGAPEGHRCHPQSPWPSHRAGASVRGLAVPYGSGTRLRHALGGGVAQTGDFLQFPLPARGAQPCLITSHPPPLAPRVPGGLRGRGRGGF